jgi:transcriptional regulator with XRE-family HTH domain
MGPHERDSWTARQLLIPHRLRTRRCELGLTQKQVVTRLARCGLRTTNRALSSLEHGTGIDVAKLPELAAALDCTVTYLIGLTDDPRCWEPDTQLVSGAPARLRSVDEPCLILGDEIPERGEHFGPAEITTTGWS